MKKCGLTLGRHQSFFNRQLELKHVMGNDDGLSIWKLIPGADGATSFAMKFSSMKKYHSLCSGDALSLLLNCFSRHIWFYN
jgi:hypothetical protein